MARVSPAERADLPQYETAFRGVEAAMGFVPNSLYTMARVPRLFEGASAMFRAVMSPEGRIPPALKQLIGLAASVAAGCRYCQAHTGATAAQTGAGPEKVAAVWDYERSPLFTDAERAALRLAQAASSVPNMAADADFAELKKHYSEEEIIEIMGVIAMFGFLNRWNDTLATDLEDEPSAFGKAHLETLGWDARKHGG